MLFKPFLRRLSCVDNNSHAEDPGGASGRHPVRTCWYSRWALRPHYPAITVPLQQHCRWFRVRAGLHISLRLTASHPVPARIIISAFKPSYPGAFAIPCLCGHRLEVQRQDDASCPLVRDLSGPAVQGTNVPFGGMNGNGFYICALKIAVYEI